MRGAGDAEQQVPASPGCCRQPQCFPVLVLPLPQLEIVGFPGSKFEASQQAGLGNARSNPQQAPGACRGHPWVLVCRKGATRLGMGSPVPALAWHMGAPAPGGAQREDLGPLGSQFPLSVQSLPGHRVSLCSCFAKPRDDVTLQREGHRTSILVSSPCAAPSQLPTASPVTTTKVLGRKMLLCPSPAPASGEKSLQRQPGSGTLTGRAEPWEMIPHTVFES